MNYTLQDCSWCDGVCYDQNVMNGTGACDRGEANIWYAPVVVTGKVFSILGPLGLVGHIIFAVVTLRKFRQNNAMMLLQGQFVTDFLYCIYVTISNFNISFKEETPFPNSGLGCTLVIGFINWTLAATLVCTCYVAYERYRRICLPFKKRLSTRVWVLLYALAWFPGILVTVVIHFIGGITPLYLKTSCFVDVRDVAPFLVVIFFTGFPICAALFWYAKIFFNLHAMFPGNTETEMRARGAAKSFIIIYMFFVVCFGPAFINSVFTQAGILTYENIAPFELAMIIGSYINSTGNPYLAIYLFPEVRKEVKNLILGCGGDKIEPSVVPGSGNGSSTPEQAH